MSQISALQPTAADEPLTAALPQHAEKTPARNRKRAGVVQFWEIGCVPDFEGLVSESSQRRYVIIEHS
jgi:hypothetical protein